MRRRRRTTNSTRWAVALTVILAAVLVAPVFEFGPLRYTAMAAMVQAFSVTVAAGVAIVTIRSDRADRRIDRVLELHRELTEGPANAARVRLARHLRLTASDDRQLIRQTTREQLRDPALAVSIYSDSSGSTPNDDISLLVRVFERAEAAREAATIDERLFTKLIGGHAGWFSMAVKDHRLQAVADAANAFADKRLAVDDPAFAGWGSTRRRDFGSRDVPTPNDRPRTATPGPIPHTHRDQVSSLNAPGALSPHRSRAWVRRVLRDIFG